MSEPAAETRLNSDYDSPGLDAGRQDSVDRGVVAATDATEALVTRDAGLDYGVAGDVPEGDVSPSERKVLTDDDAFATRDASPDYDVRPADLQAVVAQDLGSLSMVKADTTTTVPLTTLPAATTTVPDTIPQNPPETPPTTVPPSTSMPMHTN